MQIQESLPVTTLTLNINGELDHHRTKDLIQEVRNKIDCVMPKQLILDLEGLSFSDSSGIAILLRLHRSMGQVDGQMRVIHVQPQPWRLFETAGLTKMIEIHRQSEAT